MLVRRMLLLVLVTALLTVGGAAASASISSTSPASVSTVTGQQFPIDVNYQTTGMGSGGWSCTLGIVDSSVPDGWSVGEPSSVQTTGGSTSTVSSPRVEFLTTADTTMEVLLECTDGQTTATDTHGVPVVVTDPPSLSGTLQSSSSVDIGSGGLATVSFSVSNTGGADTRNARATVTVPSGYTAPDSISLTEAGQDTGVIRSGRSAGTASFTVEAGDSPTDGTVSIDLTSSRTGVTDTVTVSLDAPDTSGGGPGGAGGAGGGAGGGGGLPLQEPPVESLVATDLAQGGVADLGVDRFGLTDVAVRMAADRSRLELRVADVTGGAGVPDTGRPTYRALRMNTSAGAAAVANATVRFRVNSSWIDANGGSPADVVLLRYSEGWQELDTRRTGSDGSVVRYAAEVPGFSYFAVATTSGTGSGEDTDQGTGQDQEDGTRQDTNGTTTGNRTNRTAPGTGGDGSLLPLIGGVIVLLVLLAGVLLVALRTDILEQAMASLEGIGGDREAETIERLSETTRQVRQRMEEGRLRMDRRTAQHQLERVSELIEAGRYDDADELMRTIQGRLEQ